MADEETKTFTMKECEEIEKIFRRYETMMYLFTCLAQRNGGELLVESDRSEEFPEVGFHIEHDERGMRIQIKIGEKQP
jgi:hypothetical protein